MISSRTKDLLINDHSIAPERSSDLMRHCVYDLLLTILGRRQIRQTQNYILYNIYQSVCDSVLSPGVVKEIKAQQIIKTLSIPYKTLTLAQHYLCSV
jgi:hypothetical protein